MKKILNLVGITDNRTVQKIILSNTCWGMDPFPNKSIKLMHYFIFDDAFVFVPLAGLVLTIQV